MRVSYNGYYLRFPRLPSPHASVVQRLVCEVSNLKMTVRFRSLAQPAQAVAGRQPDDGGSIHPTRSVK